MVELADQNLVSRVYWQYKNYNDITSSGGYASLSLYPQGELQHDKLRSLATPYAQVKSRVDCDLNSLHCLRAIRCAACEFMLPSSHWLGGELPHRVPAIRLAGMISPQPNLLVAGEGEVRRSSLRGL